MKKKGKEQTNQCEKEVIEGGARDMEQSCKCQDHKKIIQV